MLSESDRYCHECEGKRAYATKADAKTAERFRLSHGGPNLRLYRCTWCRMWHHGNPNQARWRAYA